MYGNDVYDYAEDVLSHHGILGMKWGVRRTPEQLGHKKEKPKYKSTGLRSALARRSNEKVDRSFKKWKENSAKKESAIELGKKRNESRMRYEKDPTKENRSAYKKDNKEYKSALNANTTYRKGQIRQEVGSDLSRKYLSEAKKVAKAMKTDSSSDLQKKYNQLMSKHDVERERARRAPAVAAKRSARKAALKRTLTISLKAAAATTAVYAGTKALDKYGGVSVNPNQILNAGKILKHYGSYVYF